MTHDLASLIALPDATPEALRLYAESLLDWPMFAAIAFAIPLVALYSGFSVWLGRTCSRLTRHIWLAAMLFFITYSMLATLIELPVAWMRGPELLRHYGLYKATPLHWFGQRIGRTAIAALLVAPLYGAGLWLVHRLPRSWWLAVLAIYIPYSFATGLVQAHLVSPLFTTTVPLEEGPLKRRIDALARANGAAQTAIVVEKIADDYTEANAYVAGAGRALKIALTDDLIHRYTDDEVVFVVAHELGHYRLHHFWIGRAEDGLLAAIYLSAFAWLGPVIVERNRGAWGVRSISEPAAIPVALLLVAFLSTLTDPAINAVQRYKETRADAFAVRATRDGPACASFWMRDVREDFDVADPDPIEHWMRDDHPTIAERLMTCRTGVEGELRSEH